jgi:hypothetical protein
MAKKEVEPDYRLIRLRNGENIICLAGEDGDQMVLYEPWCVHEVIHMDGTETMFTSPYVSYEFSLEKHVSIPKDFILFDLTASPVLINLYTHRKKQHDAAYIRFMEKKNAAATPVELDKGAISKISGISGLNISNSKNDESEKEDEASPSLDMSKLGKFLLQQIKEQRANKKKKPR